MKILVEIADDKAASFLEILRGISFIKVQPLTNAKSELISEIREAVEEMKLIRAGKKKVRDAEDFLNEL
ncbi:MAG: hypothetical protein JJE07_01475 [Flavobacteriaceae bacterium]|nr:hypothetical protein [Flavobacteriaceae bacterium]